MSEVIGWIKKNFNREEHLDFFDIDYRDDGDALVIEKPEPGKDLLKGYVFRFIQAGETLEDYHQAVSSIRSDLEGKEYKTNAPFFNGKLGGFMYFVSPESRPRRPFVIDESSGYAASNLTGRLAA